MKGKCLKSSEGGWKVSNNIVQAGLPSSADMVDENEKHESPFRVFAERLLSNRVATLGLIVLLICVVLAILAPVIAPYDYAEIDLTNRFAMPSSEHLCGTDDFGRDMFSRLLIGARYSIGLGIAAQFFQLTLGVFLEVLPDTTADGRNSSSCAAVILCRRYPICFWPL